MESKELSKAKASNVVGKKGQGSLEYLLLMGGAVLVAVIAIGWIVSTSLTLGEEQEVQVKSQLQLLREQAFRRSSMQGGALQGMK